MKKIFAILATAVLMLTILSSSVSAIEVGGKTTLSDGSTTKISRGVPGIEVEKTVWDNEKEAWVDEVRADVGEIVEFKSTIHNSGSCNLTNIEVTDILSDSFDFEDATPVPDGTVHNPDGTTTLTWFLPGPLVPCNTETFLINATVTKCGVDTNTQYAEAEGCGEIVSDEDTATVNVPGDPGIEVIKKVWDGNDWVDETTANLGDSVQFRCEIHNSGDCADLTNIDVTDTLSKSLEYKEAEPEPDDVTHNPDGTTVLTWFLPGPLAPGETETFLIDATVIECGVDTNTQNATAECCGEIVSDEDTATVDVQGVPGIEVVKTVWDNESKAWVDDITANLNDIVLFNLTVHNNGTCCDLTDIWVWDWLTDDSFEYISAKGDTPVPDEVDYSKGRTELGWLYTGPLAPCETITYMITARVIKCGVAENYADAHAWAECTDDFVWDDDIATVTVPGVPGMKVEKTVWNETAGAWEDSITANVNDIVEFKSTIHNSGTCCNLTDIEVTDTLSDSFDFEDAIPVPEGVVQNQDGTTTLTWFLTGPLVPGDTETFLINATVTKCGVDTNTQYAEAESCEETVSDEDTATVNVPGVPGIEVTKTVWDGAAWVDEITANLGDGVQFNSTIKNIGTCADLTNIDVTDTLPKSLEYTSATPEPDEVTHPDGTTVLKWFLPGPLAADNTETFLINATVIECVDTIINTQNATAESGGETVSDEDTATVNVEGVAGIEVVKTVWNETAEAWEDSITANLNDIVLFNLTVHNNGTCCDLTDIWVWDWLTDDSFEYISAKGDTPVPDEVDYSKVGKTGLAWYYTGPLAPCETITYMITARVIKRGVAENEAGADAWAECTGDGIEDEDIATVNVPDVPGIEVEKTVLNETGAWVNEITANVNDIVEFKSTIKNIGTCCNLTDIEVIDTLSDSFDFVIAIPVPDGVVHNPDGTTTLKWFLTGPLVPGETKEFLINATVTKCGVDTNTQYAEAESCEETVSDVDTATVNVPGDPDIEVNKTVWDGTAWVKEITANLNDTVQFKAIILNSGTCCDLTNIEVTDTLSDSLEYISAIPEPNGTIHKPDGTTELIWILTGLLEPGDTETFLINAKVTKCGVDTNTQNATAESCGETVSDEDDAYVNVSLPDLVITEKYETIVGDELFNITYTVANIGCADAGPTNTTIQIDTWTPIEVPTPAIAKGGSYTNTVGPYNCPGGETLTISVCADNDNVIVESNETNNCKENELECPLMADLVITDKWLCWPDNCTICYNVTNIGEGTAHACHNTTLYVDGVAVAHDHVPVDLAPGESYIGCFDDYSWVYTTPSDNITVCADNNETVNELDEDNNCLTNIWMCGDVNGDGNVTMSDVRKVYNRYQDPNYPLVLPWAADVNCDGKVTMSDVRKVYNRYQDPAYDLNCCCKVVE